MYIGRVRVCWPPPLRRSLVQWPGASRGSSGRAASGAQQANPAPRPSGAPLLLLSSSGILKRINPVQTHEPSKTLHYQRIGSSIIPPISLALLWGSVASASAIRICLICCWTSEAPSASAAVGQQEGRGGAAGRRAAAHGGPHAAALHRQAPAPALHGDPLPGAPHLGSLKAFQATSRPIVR